MTEIRLTDDVLKALQSGRKVTITSGRFGPPGHNGTMTIHPPQAVDEKGPFEVEVDDEVVHRD